MPTLAITELGADGLAHDWNHIVQILTDIKAWANVTKLDYVNMQDNGLRAVNLRTHSRLEVGRVYVHNESGGAFSQYDLLYFSGSKLVGTVNIPTVDKAVVTQAAATTFPAMCIATEAIADASEGTVALAYEITGLDTSTLTVGDPVWLADTAGGYETALGDLPDVDYFTQVVGRVSVVHASSGRIMLGGFHSVPWSVADQVR